MSERNRQSVTATDTRDGSNEEATARESAKAGQRETGGVTTTDMAVAMKQRQVPDTQATRRPSESDSRPAPLFAGDESETYRSRWAEVQTGFVDEPRRAVESADGLVAEVVQRLIQTFSDERNRLEQQWGQGDDVSTEDLRIALQRYRSFFERLLTT
ncbi:MAG: hypothetical protein AB7R89_13990 [Dehalococcoidia bacterium]